MLIAVPRVRDILEGKEVPLSSYRGFQNPRSIDEVVFKRLINGISTRKYEKVALGFLLHLESRMLFPRRL